HFAGRAHWQHIVASGREFVTGLARGSTVGCADGARARTLARMGIVLVVGVAVGRAVISPGAGFFAAGGADKLVRLGWCGRAGSGAFFSLAKAGRFCLASGVARDGARLAPVPALFPTSACECARISDAGFYSGGAREGLEQADNFVQTRAEACGQCP